MSREVIAVDVDEVLFPCVREFTAFHNGRYQTSITPDQFLTYEYQDVLGLSTAETVQRLFEFHEQDCLHVEPLEEAQDALGKLSESYDLQIITARDPQFEKSTREWLDKNFSGIFSDIFAIGHAAVIKEAPSKLTQCRSIGAVALIDDSVKHVNSCAEGGVKGILFGDYSWNQTKPGELHGNAIRCVNWLAVGKYFDERG
jgi:5'(3')-deoxyribonucleotidase